MSQAIDITCLVIDGIWAGAMTPMRHTREDFPLLVEFITLALDTMTTSTQKGRMHMSCMMIILQTQLTMETIPV